MKDVSKLIAGRTVEMYDSDTALAAAVASGGAAQVTLFRKSVDGTESGKFSVRPYRVLREAADCITGVCMLDNRAIKVLVATYPSAPQVVLVRLALRTSWILGFVGLARRVLFGLVRVKGIARLTDSAGKRTYWLVLAQTGKAAPKIATLPKEVGIPEFLRWLRTEHIQYVVVRFYERLPELYREAGDLDLLVSDEDMPRVKSFLEARQHLLSDMAGDIRLGLHSVSGEHGTVPYYPPPLARDMLASAIDGPADSRIPMPKHALNALIYHALYHSKKGYASGIPSSLGHTDNHPENDYAGVIRRMAMEQGITVGETMEALDEYMASEGWRPKLDTLAKIAETNVWVRDRFFREAAGGVAGLAVFILREWVLERGLTEEVVQHVEREGYVVIRTKTLDSKEKQQAKEHLRGGTWGVGQDGRGEGWSPAVALVIVDPKSARLPAAYATGFERFRIRALKEGVRDAFDKDGLSSVHSTDTTREAWEYIETCFPDEVEAIREEVKGYASVSRLATLRQALSPRYLKHALKHSVREFVIRRFLE